MSSVKMAAPTSGGYIGLNSTDEQIKDFAKTRDNADKILPILERSMQTFRESYVQLLKTATFIEQPIPFEVKGKTVLVEGIVTCDFIDPNYKPTPKDSEEYKKYKKGYEKIYKHLAKKKKCILYLKREQFNEQLACVALERLAKGGAKAS